MPCFSSSLPFRPVTGVRWSHHKDGTAGLGSRHLLRGAGASLQEWRREVVFCRYSTNHGDKSLKAMAALQASLCKLVHHFSRVSRRCSWLHVRRVRQARISPQVNNQFLAEVADLGICVPICDVSELSLSIYLVQCSEPYTRPREP